jgi:hypothetical protein
MTLPVNLLILAQFQSPVQSRSACTIHRRMRHRRGFLPHSSELHVQQTNSRCGEVKFTGLQQPKSGYRPQQLRLMAVSPKEELAEVVEDRRLEIITALSDGYMGSGGLGFSWHGVVVRLDAMSCGVSLPSHR